MKVTIVGAGPAGLYFAILMKQWAPAAAIHVVERHGADETFGFGVVFSDQTLDIFRKYDPESYAEIVHSFAYWDDVEISFKGERMRIGGNGFCGCSRRTLLGILQDRATSLGVTVAFDTEVGDLSAFADSDLIVAADGANSAIREAESDWFRPVVDVRPNMFVWLGSTRPLDAFQFLFRETEHGVFIAHCYQYEAGRSTWIVETDAATFSRAGLHPTDEAATVAFLEQVFAADLDGHGLIANRSIWRNFPMIRNARWVKDNVVLLGDAKATAHFSIGSGTKLAMEDAIALYEAFRREGAVAPALVGFERDRREDVEKTQHAADVSLVWFEQLARFWDFDPVTFGFGLMTRSKAITYDNLALRAPEFVKTVSHTFAERQQASGHPVNLATPRPPMFQPFRMRDLVLPNRVAVSPMCMYSAPDGSPNDWHLVHLGARAIGGAGLIFTEMTDVSPEGRITPSCAALYTDEHEAGWARVVGFIHANASAKVCLQLGHAGRKGATRLMWDGMDQPLEEGAWPILSASPLPYYPHSQTPREMTREDMDEVRDAFVVAAKRADRAGFDMIELHCAHGYLLASFISPLTNHRTDAYGGDLAGRLRYPLEVFAALRAAWPAQKPMSVRISATDWKEGGLSGDDSVEVARAFAALGCDLIDVSAGQTVHDAEPVFGRMFQTPFSDRIRNEAGIATMCVGAITTADQVNTILAAGRADLVAIGRAHLTDPFLTMRAAVWYGVDVECPPQYGPGQQALRAQMRRERDDLAELRRRARPGRRNATDE
ncbi:bifunctional salicylyl-CoA 5-hydroxylase/oxidoreductase [Phenylobacterium sp.]|uniref:bifunctional salicylyl-CoA 5-hydroxylase/oxidoreductase n=1 Tax=Phenylobacterium sp. TaxID=1871053 RepID=UPI003002E5AE